MRRSLILLVLLISVCASAWAHQDCPTASPATVDAVVGKMTQAEKLKIIGGNGMFTFGFADAGVPVIKMSDGPAGVRTWGHSDAYPSGIALAATWDPALARSEGESLALDASERGINVLLAPGVNIYRMPMNGRNFEYFGEDPYLSSRLAVGYIDGVQAMGVAATVKHFVANNSEFDRHNTNAVIDERTLHEIYLPAFEAAVREAHVAAVMDSYNMVNGQHMTQNELLNTRLLKQDWGFSGVLMSDWTATYDGVAAAKSGLDLEMPHAKFMTPETIADALAKGEISQSTIDDKVRRIVALALCFGPASAADATRNEKLEPAKKNTERAKTVAYNVARESIVLLKNTENLLPLAADDKHSLALIGPGIKPALIGGGGSSHTETDYATNLADALTGFGMSTTTSPGLLTLREIFEHTDFENGLKQESFATSDFSGIGEVSRVDHVFAWFENPKIGGGGNDPHKSYRWHGTFVAKAAGDYDFVVAAHSGDSFSLKLDGIEVLNHEKSEGTPPVFITRHLKAGQHVQVIVAYVQRSAALYAGIGVMRGADMVLPEVKVAAAAAHFVVLSLGFGVPYESEGYDRPWKLPVGQEQLVEAVLAANPRTIVVLNGGGGMDVSAFVDRVPALLHVWYGGEMGGQALADVLDGKVNPSGKLPISFERHLEDDAAFPNYYPAEVTKDVPYKEGVFIGYRAFDVGKTAPLFPFGFGLSYTQFSFNDLKIVPIADSEVQVSLTIKNTGKIAGDDVVQLYIGEKKSDLPRPLRELKSFQRIHLNPGSSQQITFRLGARAFSYWDIETHGWRMDDANFDISAGDSSRNLPLQIEFRPKH